MAARIEIKSKTKRSVPEEPEKTGKRPVPAPGGQADKGIVCDVRRGGGGRVGDQEGLPNR
jgi:hypothetical protein